MSTEQVGSFSWNEMKVVFLFDFYDDFYDDDDIFFSFASLPYSTKQKIDIAVSQLTTGVVVSIF